MSDRRGGCDGEEDVMGRKRMIKEVFRGEN